MSFLRQALRRIVPFAPMACPRRVGAGVTTPFDCISSESESSDRLVGRVPRLLSRPRLPSQGIRVGQDRSEFTEGLTDQQFSVDRALGGREPYLHFRAIYPSETGAIRSNGCAQGCTDSGKLRVDLATASNYTCPIRQRRIRDRESGAMVSYIGPLGFGEYNSSETTRPGITPLRAS